MDLTWLIFHFFFNIVKIFYHPTHFIWNYLYLSGITLKSMIESTNSVYLIVYNTYGTMAINTPLVISTANFINIDSLNFSRLKQSITSFLHYLKVWSETSVSESTERVFCWKELWIGLLYLPDGSLLMIPRNASWNLMTDASRVRFIFIVLDPCVVN